MRLEATGKSVELESPLEPDGSGARDIKMRNSGIPGDGDTPAEAAPTEGTLRLSGVGLDDLIGLTHLHEPAILHVLCLRYASNIIYTYTGELWPRRGRSSFVATGIRMRRLLFAPKSRARAHLPLRAPLCQVCLTRRRPDFAGGQPFPAH